MYQLRGLSDCTTNPNDPVCRAFYGDESPVTQFAIPGFVVKQTAPTTPNVPMPNVQTPTPGTMIVTSASAPWYFTWWGLGLIALAGIGLWKYSRPRKPPGMTSQPTVPAGGTAGLFGVPMNENGLSYYRWIKAAGVKGHGNQTHYAAWKRGEDPSDWRAGR